MTDKFFLMQEMARPGQKGSPATATTQTSLSNFLTEQDTTNTLGFVAVIIRACWVTQPRMQNESLVVKTAEHRNVRRTASTQAYTVSHVNSRNHSFLVNTVTPTKIPC